MGRMHCRKHTLLQQWVPRKALSFCFCDFPESLIDYLVINEMSFGNIHDLFLGRAVPTPVRSPCVKGPINW